MAMTVAVGTYTTDGADDVNISIPYTSMSPNLVITHGWGELDEDGVCRLSNMPAGKSHEFIGGLVDNNIQAITAGGFQIGTAQQPGRYVYLAVGGAPTTDFNVLSYVGDGLDARAVTGAGFDPDIAIVFPGSAAAAQWSSTSHTANSSGNFFGTVAANAIQAFITDGFQVGTTLINTADVTYYAAVFKQSALRLKLLTYVGNAGADRVVTGAGFKPDFAGVDHTDVGGSNGNGIGVRFFHDTNDISYLLTAGWQTQGIRQLHANGIKVGTADHVNKNLVNYVAMCWKASVQVASIDGIAYVGAQRTGRHLRQLP